MKTESKIKTAEDKSAFLEFFTDELKDIYWAEKHLAIELPKMSKAATSLQLKEAFLSHASQTETHISRLEDIFRALEMEPVAKVCDAMVGLLKEARSILEDTEKGSMTRDAGLILAAQKAEHYEIATYGTLRIFAQVMGLDEVFEILTSTLNEEKETDILLTQIAESYVNESASEETK